MNAFDIYTQKTQEEESQHQSTKNKYHDLKKLKKAK